MTMSLSDDGSEYGEGGDGEDTGTDIDEELPDEELILVLRDEQNSIKEAQRLIHKEIKSIRRELKRLLRQYTSTHADVDLRQPQDPTASVDSGLGEVMTNTTASEVASSHGDSEGHQDTGYQAFMEYETKESTGHLEDEHRYSRETENLQETPKDPSKGHGMIEGLLHQGRTQNGFKPGYGLSLQWGDGEIHPELDLTRGKDSTYEDAYSMMRKRHSQADVAARKSTSKNSGSQWKSIIQKHGKSIYSIPESDHKHPQKKNHKESSLSPQRRGSVQSSEDEVSLHQSYPDYSPNAANPDGQLNSSGVQHRQIQQQNRRQIKRTQSEQTLKVHMDAQTKAAYMPMIKQVQVSKFHLIPSSKSAVPQERPSSDQDLPLHELDGYNGMQHGISSEDESRHTSRFADSSHDAYLGHAPQRFDRPLHASSELPLRSNHFIGRNSPKGLKRPQTSPSDSPRTKTQEQDSRQQHASPKHLFPPKDAFPGGVDVDENWNTEPTPEHQTDFSRLGDKDIHKDYNLNHAAAKYNGQKPQITKRSTLPQMKVQELVSSVP